VLTKILRTFARGSSVSEKKTADVLNKKSRSTINVISIVRLTQCTALNMPAPPHYRPVLFLSATRYLTVYEALFISNHAALTASQDVRRMTFIHAGNA
jgi:hypothetical protein